MVSFYETQGDVVKIPIGPLFLQKFRVPSLARKSLQPFEHRFEPPPSINYGMKLPYYYWFMPVQIMVVFVIVFLNTHNCQL